MTLIVTAVISILVLTSMQHILLYHKAINKQELLHQNFYQLEDVVADLAQASVSTIKPHCISHQDSANEVIKKLLKNQGCLLHRGNEDYQYFIEDLGIFPCLITYINGVKKASLHKRVSVMQMEEGIPVSLLQVRYISATPIRECLTKEHQVSMGRTSWRYFASLVQLESDKVKAK